MSWPRETMPARYMGRDSASELDFEMIVLSRSKNAASIAFHGRSGLRHEPDFDRRILGDGGVRAPGGPPGLQNRCGGESSQAGSIPVRLRVERTGGGCGAGEGPEPLQAPT